MRRSRLLRCSLALSQPVSVSAYGSSLVAPSRGAYFGSTASTCLSQVRMVAAYVQLDQSGRIKIQNHRLSSATQSDRFTELGIASARATPVGFAPFHAIPGSFISSASARFCTMGTILATARLWTFTVTVSPASTCLMSWLSRAFNCRILVSMVRAHFQFVVSMVREGWWYNNTQCLVLPVARPFKHKKCNVGRNRAALRGMICHSRPLRSELICNESRR